jgi:AraC family transcriptional regulator
LSQGKRILDVAMNYGFETHAGFTKAFKKCYGYPPSLHHLHIPVTLPERAIIDSVKMKHGGINMTPYIIELTPFMVAGRTMKQKMSNINRHSDIPAFCFIDAVEADIDNLLDNTSKLFCNSKHCEISM